jgi:hypothetical protein
MAFLRQAPAAGRPTTSVPARASARAVSPRATKDGAKVPRSNNSQRTTASAETVDAVPWEIAAAVMKQVQVTTYVSEKNLRREPTSVALLTLKYGSRVAFVSAPQAAPCADGVYAACPGSVGDPVGAMLWHFVELLSMEDL